MMWSSSCKMKTTRRREGMVADRGEELRCRVLSSHGVVSKWAEALCHGEFGSCKRWWVVRKGGSMLPPFPFVYHTASTLAAAIIHHIHGINKLHTSTMTSNDSQKAHLQKLAYGCLS